MTNDIDTIVSLAKRRGFVFPGSEIYGGLANSWDYGPLGTELKNNIKQLWWRMFIHQREDVVGIDAALVMNPKVWEASGHLKEFSDPLIECKKCHARLRADHLFEDAAPESLPLLARPAQHEAELASVLSGIACPQCKTKGQFTMPRQFNLMLKTFLGPAEDSSDTAYFRPETAQAMFVDFKNVLSTSRLKLPFGIAQSGKAFRNEITPGNFIFRTREFEQMEIEYFIPAPKTDGEWREHFEHWRKAMHEWMAAIGLKPEHVHELEIPDGERAHYSKRTIDFEYDFPFGRKELYGLAYRTDFDLQNHERASGENLKYKEIDTGREYWPHVIEPTWGVDRTVLAVLCEAYEEDGERVVLRLPARLAPYKAAVFPLLSNKEHLVEKARSVRRLLSASMPIAWDDRGNIGKRYFSQDEIGTPYCVTIDFQTLEDDTVTVRDRDTMQQERVALGSLPDLLARKTR